MIHRIWLFPWIAMLGAAIAFLPSLRLLLKSSSVIKVTAPRLIVLVVAFLVAGFACWRLGLSNSTDYIPIRGLLLGLVTGILLAIVSARSGKLPTYVPAASGLATIAVAFGRLWLTHGEPSGLIAMALGTVLVTVLLVPNDDLAEQACSRALTSTLLVTILCAFTVIGFTKATQTDLLYWADIPLLLSAGFAIAAAVGSSASVHGKWLTAGIATGAIGLIITTFFAQYVAHSRAMIGLTGAGFVVVWLAATLIASDAHTKKLAGGVGLLAVLCAAVLGFTLSSGYGIAIVALAGWYGASYLYGQDREGQSSWPAALAALAFMAVLLVHRLTILGNSSSVRTAGPGDTWEVLTVGLGLLVPLLLAEAENRPAWSSLLMVAAIGATAWAADYIWQPRPIAGLLLGAAISSLAVCGAGSVDRVRRVAGPALLLAICLYEFLPLIEQLTTPTRNYRITAALICAAVLVAGSINASAAKPMRKSTDQ
jgi:hypothetical protein